MKPIGMRVLAMLLAVGLCASEAAAQQLVGKGEWRSLTGEPIKGTWTATLARDGNRVQGNLDLTGSNVFSAGAVSGEIDALGITLGVMVDGAQQATFSGKLEGDSISGEWECDAVKDHGVWYGRLARAKSGAAPQ
jgi:hypothetical protein